MAKVFRVLFVTIQHLVPQHLLSRAVGWAAETEFAPVRKLFIAIFIRAFKVDVSEARETDTDKYPSFNAFFTRELKDGARPLCPQVDAIACPADGHLSELGDIHGGRLIQAKGKDFRLKSLLGGDEAMSALFAGGKFATIYLSPQDYHRVHMPLDATLRSMVHVPGRLFSVNAATTELVDELFARNERVVCLFETEAGPMAMILVGAMICASVETTWAGLVTPIKRQVRTSHYPGSSAEVTLRKGEEMGRFKLGSTVVLLFGPEMAQWCEHFQAQSRVRMGEQLGALIDRAGAGDQEMGDSEATHTQSERVSD
ncbi:archaetidylserine decarboxylase [Gilvimarinus sp. F26214L]|uniref:archaetidylserine decarboxylase n=1 Tax=Gilvimarinus sp. DZF01 TaxID=3461371 RepID=UPI00404543E7